MFDFICFYNLVFGIRIVGTECQIQATHMLFESQVPIHTVVTYDTIVLSWVGL